MRKRPYILTIAGFDPSGGAGILSDIKTMEGLRTYGLSVCTANTVQNDQEFQSCHWTNLEVIKAQIEILFSRFKIDVVKIGIVQDLQVLNVIIDLLISKNKDIRIVLDPILRASAGFDFRSDPSGNADEDVWNQILEKIYLITPNYDEIQQLYPKLDVAETITKMQGVTNLLVKGGHRQDALGKDELFVKNGDSFVLNPKPGKFTEKHGSGCILSSAIASYLGLGFPLLKACYRAKRYTEKRLASNRQLLAYHKM